MDNRYAHFADNDVRNAEYAADEARDKAKLSLLNWQKKMEDQLVKDTLETLEKLRATPEEEFTWRATSTLKFLVHNFASGILYAQKKLG